MKTTWIVKKISSFIGTKQAHKARIFVISFIFLTGVLNAQTGVLKGTGMGICNTFSFNSTAGVPVTPLNYGNQYYQCTGLNADDVSFSPQGNLWRVEKYSWSFTPTTSAGGNLNGIDEYGNAITTFYLPTGSVLTPVSYFLQNGVNCVMFNLTGYGTLPGVYDRDNFIITAP